MAKKTELITTSDALADSDDYIDSQELLVLVNEARKECGQKPIRNNDFVARIKDELSGEAYESFVTPMDSKKGGADQEVIGMCRKQALRVAARESKAVRRVLVDKIEARSQPVFDTSAALNDPEFLRGTLLGYTEKVIALEHKVEEVTTERDEAIRAKSRISRKREASALGKLSAATRRCRDLEEQLGETTRHATIIKVENATGRKDEFSYVPLRRWCKDNGVEAKAVPDERYGSVKSWPAGAWLDIYGIDLKSLFGA
ncbi:ORF6N domain-containing protein [Salmonella enterica]